MPLQFRPPPIWPIESRTPSYEIFAPKFSSGIAIFKPSMVIVTSQLAANCFSIFNVQDEYVVYIEGINQERRLSRHYDLPFSRDRLN